MQKKGEYIFRKSFFPKQFWKKRFPCFFVREAQLFFNFGYNFQLSNEFKNKIPENIRKKLERSITNGEGRITMDYIGHLQHIQKNYDNYLTKTKKKQRRFSD